MLGHVIPCKSSAEVWSVLEQIFSTKSKAKVLQLRFLLQTIKKGSGSLQDFVLKMKNTANELMAAGDQFISDDEILI